MDPDGETRQHIFRIDPSTGAFSDVGSIGLLTLHSNIGMAYDPVLDRLLMTERPLYADGSFGSASYLYSINPYTASATLVGPTSFESTQFEITALAFVPDPVPEPSTFVMWSIFAALGLAYGWRQRNIR